MLVDGARLCEKATVCCQDEPWTTAAAAVAARMRQDAPWTAAAVAVAARKCQDAPWTAAGAVAARMRQDAPWTATAAAAAMGKTAATRSGLEIQDKKIRLQGLCGRHCV
eukprot:1158705-Pelagomonas_calceolata.AAC.24